MGKFKRLLTDAATWTILKSAFEKVSSFQKSEVSLDSCGSSSAVSDRMQQTGGGEEMPLEVEK